MSIKKFIFYFFLCNTIGSCTKNVENSNKNVTEQYVKIISERKEVASLLRLYSDSIQYENRVIDEKFHSKEELQNQRTIEWSDSLYQFQPDFPKSISVESITYSANNALIKGIILPYTYNSKLINPKEFITSLYFNSEGKIIKQVDWIDYPMPEILTIFQLQKSLEQGTTIQTD